MSLANRDAGTLVEEMRAAGLTERDILQAQKRWTDTGAVTLGKIAELMAWIDAVLASPLDVTPGVVVLWGDPGNGKSTVAAKMLRRYLLGDGMGAVWVLAQHAIETAMRERKLDDGPGKIEARIHGAKILFIDDIGGVQRLDSEPQVRALEMWILAAFQRRCPIVVTTNQDLSRGECAGMSPMIQSRLGSGMLVGFRPGDIRAGGLPK